MHSRPDALPGAILLSVLLAGLAAPAAAVAGNPANGVARVALLELYTSEGCNSCPPADRWVSSLPRSLVPDKLVVLAFHVDYWNYLGWEDRFSQKNFTTRQQALVRANRLRTAYTPQLALNGRDYRRSGDIRAQVADINAQPAGVQIRLNASRTVSSLRITAIAEPTRTSSNEPMELYVALYENNLETEVKAGENRGERLRHDYVVRTLIGPVAVAPGKPAHWHGQIPLAGDWKLANLGLAAFVQTVGGGEVFQATSLPVP